MTTFVSVGNATQSFSRLIDAVLKIASHLPQPVVVQHGNTIFQGVGCVAKPFLEMEELGQFMAQAELLILHAGAGPVIHAIQAGKVPVVMPRLVKYGEHVDDHQLDFARVLAKAGKIVVAEATAHAVPVIASQGTPWAEVEVRDCGLWANNSFESLAEAIGCVRNKTLPEMGMRGRDWMKEEFGGATIAGKMFGIYTDLTRNRARHRHEGETVSGRG